MIVSASRRTDIPAFYLDWLMGRLTAGYCLVRSPYGGRPRRVELDPAAVDCVVFWTRDPRALTSRAAEIEATGFRFYVHVTLNAYPADIEPAGLGIDTGTDALRGLADAIGPERTLWRYDPVFVAEGLDADFHRSAFDRLTSLLEGSTRRVTVSLLDEYLGTASRLERSGYPDVAFGSARGRGARISHDATATSASPASHSNRPPDPYPELLADMSAMARSRGIEILACAEPYDLSPYGIGRGSCIDPVLIASLRGETPADHGRDKGQRPGCLCAPSVDIGAYGTCPAHCAYCYANRGAGRLSQAGAEDEAL